MKKRKVLSLLGLLVGVALLVSTAAVATSLPQIVWEAIASGGGRGHAAALAIEDTIGQPIIGQAGAGPVTLGSGFWYGAPRAGPSAQPSGTPTPTETATLVATATPTQTSTATPIEAGSVWLPLLLK